MCSNVRSGELGSWCIIHFGTVKRLQIRAGGRQKEGGRGTDHALEWRKKKKRKSKEDHSISMVTKNGRKQGRRGIDCNW